MKIYKQYTLTHEELFEMAKPEMDAMPKHFLFPAITEMLENSIEGDDSARCIYGRLTGSCNSEEAKRFIQKYIKHLIKIDNSIEGHIAYNKILSVEESFQKDVTRAAYYETPLEQYIYPTKEEEDFQDNNGEWPKSYDERIEKVKIYIKSKIA